MRLERYLASVADYQKNKFKVLPEEQRAKVDEAMGDFMRTWGYSQF
jgi:hypothetical protein